MWDVYAEFVSVSFLLGIKSLLKVDVCNSGGSSKDGKSKSKIK